MIIGINGKIGSGKDLVGKIIQYLIWKNKTNSSKPFSEVERELSGWEIKKFADKLKDIVCILTGCTREQLEDQDFKETPLGKEWNWGNHNFFGPKITPRQLLQYIGTNLFRNQLHPNVWINALMSECKYRYEDDGIEIKERFESISNWIITDVRFPNEVKAIKDKSGIIIRVNRITNNSLIDNDTHAITNYQHTSETALDNYEGFDYIIENDGSIEDLITKVEAILIQQKII